MAKFIKSIFQAPEKKKNARVDGDSEEVEVTALSERRKLSMSRSGRLKHAYKKRHSLSLELYGEDLQAAEKPKAMEYHVHNNSRRPSSVNETQVERKISASHVKQKEKEPKSPEEEIDNAFEIIDKS